MHSGANFCVCVCVCVVVCECHEGRKPVVASCVTFLDPPSSLKQRPGHAKEDLLRCTRPSVLKNKRCLEDKSRQISEAFTQIHTTSL